MLNGQALTDLISSKRRFFPVASFTLILALVVGFNLAAWFAYRGMKTELEQLERKRLLAIAQAMSPFIDTNQVAYVDVQQPSVELVLLAGDIETIAKVSEVDQIAIIDRSHQMRITSLDPLFLEPARYAHVSWDRQTIDSALNGTIAQSDLLTIRGSLFLHVCSPLNSVTDGGHFVLCIEDSLESLRLFPQLIGWLQFLALVSIAILVAGFFAQRHLFRRSVDLEQELHEKTRLATLGRLGSTIAHEIRNPLGIIMNSAELARQQLTHGKPIDPKYLESIPEEIERLNGILTHYLEFSREAPLQLTALDLCGVLNAIAAAVTSINGRSVSIRVNCEATTPLTIDADRDKLRQVVLNLIHNSADAADGSIEIDINVASRRFGRRKGVQIVFRDNGRLDPVTDLAQLLTPYYTTKSKGTGLGLAICKRMIDAHEGAIQLLRKDRRLVVEIWLPIHQQLKDVAL